MRSRPCLRRPVLLLAAVALAHAVAPAQQLVYETFGLAQDGLGTSLAGLGDIDGDGVPDYAVGVPYSDLGGNSAGHVEVYSGKTGKLRFLLQGAAAGDLFGFAVDGVGDVNGDGVGDLLIGAPGVDAYGFVDAGRVYVHSGKTGAQIKYTGHPQAGARSGHAVCGTGDVDGDGVPDFAFGAPQHDFNLVQDRGRVTLFSNGTNQFLWSRDGEKAFDAFGWALDRVGDLNNDGRSEVVVGAPGYDVVFNNNGRGYVLNGASGVTMYVRTGTFEGGALGFAVAGLGDLNGDGKPEVAFGEPLADVGGVDTGRVSVISTFAAQPLLHDIHGPAGSQTGRALCALGDIDDDQVADLAVGLPRANFLGAADIGWVWLVSGASGAPITTLIGKAAGDQHGLALDGIGDLNGDGRADLVVGAPYSDAGGLDSGAARVYLTGVTLPATYCTAKVTSAGCVPKISSSGTPSLSIAGDFHLRADKLMNHVVGILIWSKSPAATPFGGGILCLGGQITRGSGMASGGVLGVPCTGSFDVHFSQAYMAGHGLAGGMHVYAQFWSRDPGFASPNDMSLTNALHFQVLY